MTIKNMAIFYHHYPYIFMCCLSVLGAIAGSFLHVCIVRIPKGMSVVSPGSHCPACKKPIPFYYNIPIVSYFMLGGRCHHCKQPISAGHVAVEILSACLPPVFVLRFGLTFEAVIYCLFAFVLIVVSCIDGKYGIIPDRISIPGAIVFSFAKIFMVNADFFFVAGGVITGSGSLFLISLVYYLIRKQIGIGGGDIKLMAMIGGVTGAQGALFSIFIASLSGCLAGILMILRHIIMKRKTEIMQQIPFGPFLSFSALLYLFYGEKMIHWYISFSMLGPDT